MVFVLRVTLFISHIKRDDKCLLSQLALMHGNERKWKKKSREKENERARANGKATACNRFTTPLIIYTHSRSGTAHEARGAMPMDKRWCVMVAKRKRDILANNGMLCAMSWKIEKCRTKHFVESTERVREWAKKRRVNGSEHARVYAFAPRVSGVSISFPINVNYVIFSHKMPWNKGNESSGKMVRKNRWNTLVLFLTSPGPTFSLFMCVYVCWMSFKTFCDFFLFFFC